MKYLIYFLFVSLTFNVLAQDDKDQSQTGLSFGETYKTLADLVVKYNDGSEIKSRTAKAGLKYKYIQTVTNRVFIKFLRITKDTETTKADTYVNENNWDVTYWVDINDIRDFHKVKTSSLVSGTLLAPIKIRPSIEETPWDLSTDISLGQYLGYRILISQTNPYYITFPILTLGTSLLSIDSSNTTPEANSTTLGLTWSTGIILELDGFTLGFILGKDYAPGQAGKNWIYNEKVWFSVGFGVNLTSKNKDL